MKTWLWFRDAGAVGVLVGTLLAQVPEPELPRPGTVVATEITGEVTSVAGDQRKPIKLDDRLRVGTSVVTGRRSLATFLLSNGASIQLGPEAELEIEEFGQAAFSGTSKFGELKEEPTASRTRLRLVRGDVTVVVKPLKVSRGSSFTLTTVAGVLRTSEAEFRAAVRIHDLGLGVYSVDLKSGRAEFEVAGTSGFQPVPAGRQLAFAIELDKSGGVKVSEMPKAPEKK